MIFANMTTEELEKELIEIGEQINAFYSEDLSDEAAASLLRLEKLAISIELTERGVK